MSAVCQEVPLQSPISTAVITPLFSQEKKETVKTNYSLSDTVFAKAELKCDGRVCIWLGVSPVCRSGSMDRGSRVCNGVVFHVL